jgi:hypothetical protein
MDPVWQFFMKIDDDTKVKYTECGAVVSAKTERLRNHHARCIPRQTSTKVDVTVHLQSDLGLPSAAAEESVQTVLPVGDMLTQGPEPHCSKRARHDEINVNPSHTTSFSVTSEQQDQSVISVKKGKLQQPHISQFGITTDKKMQEQLDEQVARFFFSCNIPFSVVEQEEFKRLMTMLRPGYKPPNRKTLGSTLLDKVHGSLSTAAASRLHGKDVTLIQDGWSDVHNSPVIAQCVQNGSEAYFLSSVESGANKKTAEYCSNLAKEALEENKVKFGCQVVAVVTDNEKKMQKMRELLHSEYEDLIVYGCASHWMNLLGQDVTSSQIVSQIVEINKFFRNHHAAGSLLDEQKGSLKPQLPGDTRWNSQLDSIHTFLINRPFMILIVAQQDSQDSQPVTDSPIAKLINNIGLLNEAKNLHSQLQPIAKALDRLQSDTASIADACEEWLVLLQQDELKTHLTTVTKRFKEAVTEFHYLANLLHPRYRGKRLSAQAAESARQLLISLHPENPEIIADLCAFQAGAEPFPPSLMSASCVDHLAPTIWWTSILNSKATVSPLLINVALKLLRLPSSSAAIERVFSNFGLVQSKLRNQLGLEKAAKLVMCYRQLRGRTEMDWKLTNDTTSQL